MPTSLYLQWPLDRPALLLPPSSLPRRLNVHEHIGDARVRAADGVFHLMRDGMIGPHRDRFIRADVPLEIKIQAMFRTTLVDISKLCISLLCLDL
jgi:hypothetical protein